MIQNLIKGFGYLFRGLHLITRPGIRRFVLIPLSINIVLFGGASWYLFSQFEYWMSYLMPDFPSWLSWLESAISWLLWPMFSALILFLVFYTFSFLANLIAAPFNSVLAQKVEKHLTQQPLDSGPNYPGLELIKRSIASELAKLSYFMKWWFLLLLLSMIPVVNFAAPFMWIIFGAWMLSLEYLDYPMSNHNKYFKDINKQALTKRSLSLGLGGSIMLFTSIPVLNLVAMPAGVAGATALWVKQREQIS